MNKCKFRSNSSSIIYFKQWILEKHNWGVRNHPSSSWLVPKLSEIIAYFRVKVWLVPTNLQLTEPTVYRPCVQKLQTLLHGLWSDQLRQSNHCLHGVIGPTLLCCTSNTVTLEAQVIFIIHEIQSWNGKVVSTSALCSACPQFES